MDFISDLLHRKKSPEELIAACLKHEQVLEQSGVEDEKEKSTDKLAKHVHTIKQYTILNAEDSTEDEKQMHEQMIAALYTPSFFVILTSHFSKLEFEAKKDLSQIFCYLMRKGDYLRLFSLNPDLLKVLVDGCEEPDVALHCGVMLREAVGKHEEITRRLLTTEYNGALFFKFFLYVQKSNFDIASDAFDTFKLVLTKHKAVVAEFLENNYDQVFAEFNELIQSENYVTKRQSIKLLGELLLDRPNFNIMLRYINISDNLIILMQLLRGQSKNIQFEAFHVFKVFVANPNKHPSVLEILRANRDRLISFLQKFKTDKDTDLFLEEKAILLGTLEQMEPLP